MEKMRPVKEEMDREVFSSRQSRHISFVNELNRVLFTSLYHYWRTNNFGNGKRKGIKKRNYSTTKSRFLISL